MTGKLRIVAGEFGGRLIECPRAVSRPTTDRVREALLSALVSAAGGFEGITVCDAFAGSGALGLEAVSRGAARAQLFDADAGAVQCVRRNVAALGLADRVHVARADVLASGIAGAAAPYGLVLLDPPYVTEAERVGGLLARAAEAGQLAEGCLVAYERAADASALPELARFQVLKQKRYGKTAVDLLRWR